MTGAVRSLSVLLATRGAEVSVARAIEALGAERPEVPWDLLVVDAGSAAHARAALEAAVAGLPVPARVEGIHPVEHDASDTRNELAARTRGDLLVYLDPDDAAPAPGWLAALVGRFRDGRTAAVCDASGRVRAVRRDAWERHPFPRARDDADACVARALRGAGLGVEGGAEAAPGPPATRALERTGLRVLFVVHGFPPETWAGTEVYTLHLATELQRLGHRCVVFARTGAGDAPDFSLAQGEFRGLRVWRMTNRLVQRGLRDTYDLPEAVAAFREVLIREDPDVVHFQHLIHLSAGLVRQARDFDLPTVLHCHDYWALCARVQLIRPDGVRCEENQGPGCFACVSGRGLSTIPRLKRWGTGARPLVEELAQGRHRGKPLEGQRLARWDGFGDLMARQAFVLDAFAAADLRISPSRFLRGKLLETGAFDARSTLYSDNGIPRMQAAQARRVSDPQGRVRFGFVGSIVWYKGCRVLVEAMARLAGRPAVLHVFGDFRPEEDPHHAELRALARGAAVEFRGRFDHARLAEVYAEVDVLVVPSLWFENAPITIQEAFLHRTPVVASGIGGMAEFVRDGVDGLHFRTGDAGDLAAKLERFLDEPGLREALSGSFPPVKTVEANARETEYRYRSLCTVARERRPRLLIEREGIETLARVGPVEQQGADMVLLRPGGSAVEYDVSLAGAGPLEVEIDVPVLGAERDVPLGARVLVDGREVGTIAAFASSGADELRRFRVRADLDRPARVLRLECGRDRRRRETFLRVGKVTVREAAARPR